MTGDATSVDEAVLATLRELGGEDDPGFFPNLVREFLKHLDEAVPGLRAAVAAGDSKALERVAHALKGSSGNMGAKPLSAMSAELQRMGRVGQAAGAEDRVETLASEAAKVRAILAPMAPRAT